MKSRILALTVTCALLLGFTSSVDAGFEWAGDSFNALKEVFTGDQSSKASDVRYRKATISVAETDAAQGSFDGDGSQVVNARGNFCERWDGNGVDCDRNLSEFCFDIDGDGEAGSQCVMMQDYGSMASLGLFPKSAAKDCGEDVSRDPRNVVCPLSKDDCSVATSQCAICIHSNGIGSCDGRDNNCNGFVDEDSEWTHLASNYPNDNQEGVCAGSTQSCSSGAWVDDFSRIADYSTTDTCDGLDNDCDGQVDEEPDASDSCSGGRSCHEGSCCVANVGDSCNRQSGNTCYENGTVNCEGTCEGGTVTSCVCRFDFGIFDSCIMQ